MYTEIFWINAPVTGQIGIMPRPRGGDWLEDEIRNFKNEGINVIVSLLTRSEVIELDLSNEESLCNQYLIDYYSVPVEDRCVPESMYVLKQCVSEFNRIINDGKKIAVHCRQGIGRSSLLAAAVLMSFGISSEEAFRVIEAARLRPVPDTKEQRMWLTSFEEFISFHKVGR